jgi:hypothetical protein
MRGKMLLVVGLATGYVLGSRAGRERYEQIKTGADKVWNLAPVQQAAGAVKGFAGERVDTLQSKAGDAAKKAISSLLHLDQPSSKSGSSKSAKSKRPSGSSATPPVTPPATPPASTPPPAAASAASADTAE